MLKKVLIFVPHPDDEINLAGGLFETLKKHGVHTTVVITTNGDYDPRFARKRYFEAKKVQKIFGYDELIFLGYGDDYQGVHILDLKEGEVATSHAGQQETYCAGDEDEYCFQKTGKHNSYTRQNYKNDIKTIILDKRADLIICVDKDAHPDHKCLSMLFDEVMCEVLNKFVRYYPVVLKGFAYMGVWKGLYDFFDRKVQPLHPCNNNRNIDISTCLPYNWDDRIRLKSASSTTTLDLLCNKHFLALRTYVTQCRYISANDCATAKFPRVANPESCFWLLEGQDRTDIYRRLQPLVQYTDEDDYVRPALLCSILSTIYGIYMSYILLRNKIRYKLKLI